MVFLGLKLHQENQKKTEENRRKPEEKKTTAPPITRAEMPLTVGRKVGEHAQLFARESSGPYLDCAMCYMPHALLRIKSEDKKKTGALTPNQRGGALVYQTVHQPGFISLTHCGPESVPR